MTIINKLEKENQIKNIYVDKNNNIHYNQEFNNYKNNLDDFLKFELEKIL